MMMSIRVSSSWQRELNPDKGWLQRQIAAWKVFFKMLSKEHLDSEQRDHMMRQVVAYKRLKTMKNYKTIMPISGCSRLWEVIVYKRFTHGALTGKILVFWIAGA